MAADIVPVRLGLTKGDLYTLWAPLWRDSDDEWQGFLGKDDDLYAFESVADLVAFVRTSKDNDLTDHPAWEALTEANAHVLDPPERAPARSGRRARVGRREAHRGDRRDAAAGAWPSSRPSVRCATCRGLEVLQRQPGAGLAGRRHRRVRRPRGPQALVRDRGGDRAQLGRRRSTPSTRSSPSPTSTRPRRRRPRPNSPSRLPSPKRTSRRATHRRRGDRRRRRHRRGVHRARGGGRGHRCSAATRTSGCTSASTRSAS